MAEQTQLVGRNLADKSRLFFEDRMEDVSLLATGKTGFREAISTLVTGVALRWVIFICKEGLYCLLIRISSLLWLWQHPASLMVPYLHIA